MAVDAVRDTADRLESSAESRRTEHRQRLTRQMLQELLSYMMKNRCLDAWGPAGGGGGSGTGFLLHPSIVVFLSSECKIVLTQEQCSLGSFGE